MYDYETIKAAAKMLGRKVTDLLALSPQNDPFYAGTPADRAQAEWFAGVWQRAGYVNGVHLRRAHYWCVSQQGLLMHNGLPYENTDKCWGYLTQASKMARYLGMVRIEDIADHKSPPPVIGAQYFFGDGQTTYEIETPELTEPTIYISGLRNVNAQPYHLEIWCEKSTMNDVLEPICQRFNANLCTFEGEVSITACYQLVRRITASGGKPTRVFYISDFDPAGNSMPVATARKIEYMLNHFQHDYDVKLKPVVLTLGQVRQYQLPRTPIKETERRAATFENAFGTGAVELDALEALYPGTLDSIVTGALQPYYNIDAAAEIERQHTALWQAIKAQIDTITAKYAAEIEAVRQMQDELRAIDIHTGPFAVGRYEPHVSEAPTEWLFDSQRPYTEQISYYKAHKGCDSATGAA